MIPISAIILIMSRLFSKSVRRGHQFGFLFGRRQMMTIRKCGKITIFFFKIVNQRFIEREKIEIAKKLLSNSRYGRRIYEIFAFSLLSRYLDIIHMSVSVDIRRLNSRFQK